MSAKDTNEIVAVVTSDTNYKEYDKLFTLFTREYGKIKAYAFGVRRAHSKKIGALRLFSFCKVSISEVNEKFSIKDAEIIEDFEKLAFDYEAICYASYFIEVIDYFGYENIESGDVFELLYYSLKALEQNKIRRELVKYIFELKMLKYQGIYIEKDDLKEDNETLKYAWNYVLVANPKKLYSFELKDDILKLFGKEVEKEFKSKVDKKFISLESI